MTDQQSRMNAHYFSTIVRLRLNAERDLRLARAGGDPAAVATARARYETLGAALGVYAAAHLHAHGIRPWPKEQA